MRDLLAKETDDIRAAEAVALFCYQAKKWIGALPLHLADWTRWFLPVVLVKTARSFAPAFVKGLGFLGIET